MIKSGYVQVLMPLVLAFILIGAIHIVSIQFFLPEIYRGTPYYSIYLFFVPLTIGALGYIVSQYHKNPRSVGKNFFIYVIIKMIAILGFLSPWLLYKSEYTRPFVYQFLIVFFLLLFLETYQLVRMLNEKIK